MIARGFGRLSHMLVRVFVCVLDRSLKGASFPKRHNQTRIFFIQLNNLEEMLQAAENELTARAQLQKKTLAPLGMDLDECMIFYNHLINYENLDEKQCSQVCAIWQAFTNSNNQSLSMLRLAHLQEHSRYKSNLRLHPRSSNIS